MNAKTPKIANQKLPNIPDEFKIQTEDEARRLGLNLGDVPLGQLGPLLDRLFWEIENLRALLDQHTMNKLGISR